MRKELFKIYIGQSDSIEKMFKIGYTQQTCWERCKRENYTIFGAFQLELTFAEVLFIESYLRMRFTSINEALAQIRTDYFILNTTSKSWAYDQFSQFCVEAAKLIEQTRTDVQKEVLCAGEWFEEVAPYTY